MYGDTRFVDHLEFYMLPGILDELGPPDQVLLETYAEDLPGMLPFRLLLFYLDQGVSVMYEGNVGREGIQYGPIEDEIVICPWRSRINLWLWSPADLGNTLEDILPFIDSQVGSMNNYLPLEEATDMTIEQFYASFVHSDDLCFETPASLW